MALGGAGGRGGYDQSTLQSSLRTTKKYTSHNVLPLGSVMSLTIFFVCVFLSACVFECTCMYLWVCMHACEFAYGSQKQY